MTEQVDSKGRPLRPITAGRVARRVLAFYGGDASRYTARASARDSRGHVVVPCDLTAVCWCPIGVIEAVLNQKERSEHFYRAKQALNDACHALHRKHMPAYVDEPSGGRSFAEVEAELKRIARLP